jgi:hypothetical protein
LRASRLAMSHCTARLRDLKIRADDLIAQAMWDGVRPSAVAAAAQTTLRTVRTIGLASEDLEPSEIPHQHQLAAIIQTTGELNNASKAKTIIEQRQAQALSSALRSKTHDEHHLSTLTGIPAHEILKISRTQTPIQSAKRPGQ